MPRFNSIVAEISSWVCTGDGSYVEHINSVFLQKGYRNAVEKVLKKNKQNKDPISKNVAQKQYLIHQLKVTILSSAE